MPFSRATRQNFMPAPAITYAAGQTTYSQLPKVGLISRVIALFTGTYDFTAGTGVGAAGAEGPWSLISRIRLVANGNTALFDTSGYGAMIAGLFSAHGFGGYGVRPVVNDSATAPGPASATIAAAVYAFDPTQDSTWKFAIEIPLTIADDWRDPVGLILAAAPDTQLQLEVTWAASLYSTTASRNVAVTTTGTASATLTATLTPYIEFFTIPGSPADYPDLRRIHTWTELGPQTISANGDQDVILPRGNTIMRAAHIVWTNTAADATNVSQAVLRMNSNELPYQLNRQALAFLQRQRYIRDLPAGVYAWDLWNTGTPRDAINTLNLNELKSTLTLAGATISGTSDIRTLVESLVSLTGAATGSA